MKTTLEFTTDAGAVHVCTFDDATHTATADGQVFPSSRSGNAITLQLPDGPLVLTIAAMTDGAPPAVGSTSPYHASNGDKGVVRLVSIG